MNLKTQLIDFFTDFGTDNLVLNDHDEEEFIFEYDYGSFSWLTCGNETSSKIDNIVIMGFPFDLRLDLNDSEVNYIENLVYSSIDIFGVECIDFFSSFNNNSLVLIHDCSFSNQGKIDRNHLKNTLKNLSKCAKKIRTDIDRSIIEIYRQKKVLEMSEDFKRLYI